MDLEMNFIMENQNMKDILKVGEQMEKEYYIMITHLIYILMEYLKVINILKEQNMIQMVIKYMKDYL